MPLLKELLTSFFIKYPSYVLDLLNFQQPKHSDIAMYMCVCFEEHVQVYFLSDSVKKHGYFMCIVKQNSL